MSILLSEKSKEFINKNNISYLLIDITFIEEPCTQIYDPKIEIIKSIDTAKYQNFEKVPGDKITLYLSKQFIEIYGKLNEYQLDVGGFFKKVLILKSVDPIIKNICKI